MAVAYAFTTDEFVRFDRGASGYLDMQAMLNQDQLAVFRPLLAPAGEQMELLLASILELSKFATACEIKVRENERLVKLGRLNETQAFDAVAASFNQQAIRYARRGLNITRQVKRGLDELETAASSSYHILPKEAAPLGRDILQKDNPISRLREVHINPDFASALTDAKEAFLYNALRLNFTNNVEFVEILEIWDKSMDLAAKEGVRGLLNSMEESLDQFVARRMTDERGTSPASPLEWWKYVVIALYVGAAVFAVIACFWWSACTWVWPAISATAPWIFKIVEMGC